MTRARKVETLRARYAARAEELAEHAHPLDPLSPEEYESVAHAVRHDERFRYHMRFASASLVEPTKRELTSGADIERKAEALLLDGRRRVTYIVLVDVRQRAVTAWDEVPGQQQPAITIDEFVDIEIETKSDPRVQDALRRRGLDLQQRALVMVDPWSAGNFDIEAEKGRRIAQLTFYMRSQNDDNQYAHPIDGMIALIDLDTLELIDVEDEHIYPVPMDDGNYGEKFVDEWRDDIKPLAITQPEGPSFRRGEGELAEVELRYRLHPREGLTLHHIRYNDEGHDRPILYRALLAEMVVPYGDPATHGARTPSTWASTAWACARTPSSSAATASERSTTSTPPVSARGPTRATTRSVCTKRTSASSGSTTTDAPTGPSPPVPPAGDLVISTVENYEYGFFWYFYQDGNIEFEVKLTGIVQTGALHDGETNRHGVKLGPNLYAPHHQHFFCVRLDPTIDGIENRVTEVNTHADPFGSDQPLRQCLLPRPHHLRQRTRRHSRPQPRDCPLLAHQRVPPPQMRSEEHPPTGSFRERTASPTPSQGHPSRPEPRYMYHHLWVTPWSAEERFPAGTFPNQSHGDDGLAVWTAADRNIRRTDVVVWYTLGHHHVVRPEDWPVMPVARMGFALKPSGFFTQNPALDVPVATSPGRSHGHC